MRLSRLLSCPPQEAPEPCIMLSSSACRDFLYKPSPGIPAFLPQLLLELVLERLILGLVSLVLAGRIAAPSCPVCAYKVRARV
jgi:hypothetical protein